ncbi:hypothetical protein T484DRAFT_1902716 [Baffinella frigidus]|nr:hypothetical protein T484DRAFT_1902716 [Cryptophyta sp. CCMP2293]
MRLVALIIVATASQLLGVHAFAVPGGAAVSLTLRRPTQASGFKGGASIPFRVRSREQPVGGLRMVLGPVGPFSPFRSAYISSNAVDRDMQKLVGLQMESAKKMQSLQENGGDAPNKDDVRRLAAELEETNEQWLYMLTRSNHAVPGQHGART